jgi:hypothetical protein
VTVERFHPANDDGRVVPFRRRGAPPPSGWRWRLQAPREVARGEFAKYEQAETEDDYRHRMTMNLLGLAVTVVLMCAGMWLAITMAEIQKTQDCVMQGRRDCMKIEFKQPDHGEVHWRDAGRPR